MYVKFVPPPEQDAPMTCVRRFVQVLKNSHEKNPSTVIRIWGVSQPRPIHILDDFERGMYFLRIWLSIGLIAANLSESFCDSHQVFLHVATKIQVGPVWSEKDNPNSVYDKLPDYRGSVQNWVFITLKLPDCIHHQLITFCLCNELLTPTRWQDSLHGRLSKHAWFRAENPSSKTKEKQQSV